MANLITLRRSMTAGVVPTSGTAPTGQLNVNEIGMNTADAILYINFAGTIYGINLGGPQQQPMSPSTTQIISTGNSAIIQGPYRISDTNRLILRGTSRLRIL